MDSDRMLCTPPPSLFLRESYTSRSCHSVHLRALTKGRSDPTAGNLAAQGKKMPPDLW